MYANIEHEHEHIVQSLLNYNTIAGMCCHLMYIVPTVMLHAVYAPVLRVCTLVLHSEQSKVYTQVRSSLYGVFASF